MIKAIIFDFDGVLVKSTSIKTNAFRKLFSKWQNKMEEGVNYHLNNMGISRYVKFKYFFENILKEPYSDEIGQQLGRQFSEIVVDEIKEAPFVNGGIEFLEKNQKKYMFFIASGTPQEELNKIIYSKGIGDFFKDIYGTPSTKSEIVNGILKRYKLERNQVVFVGDAESDKRAAEDTGIHFVLRSTPENKSINSDYKIGDLSTLEDILKEFA